jgi:micrococcal nuclease
MKTQRILTIILLILVIYLGYSLYEQRHLKTSSPQPSSSPSLSQSESTPSSQVLSESTKSADISKEPHYLVTRVIDGDTIEIEMNGVRQSVRLIGIDTPETVDPRRKVGCFGKEASNETKRILNGRSVVVEKDVSETDKYGRRLFYVYLPLDDGSVLFVNDYLVRAGYARVLTYPPDVRFNERFLQAEQEARAKNAGLWGMCEEA